ncbi:MAG: hypothetical protein HKP56_03415 [Anderseniella sp.]|nr:hypothetical protein [Anderseniella sp.]
MTIRPARSDDIDEIITLLHIHMNRRISRERWKQLFTYSWITDKPDFGRVATATNRIVGYLGAIYSDRMVDGEVVRYVNPNSWYMEKAARREVKGISGGLGLELMHDLTRDENLHFHINTSSRLTTALLRRAGFRVLDQSKLVWSRSASNKLLERFEVIQDIGTISSIVDAKWRQVIEDHRTWPVSPLLVRSQGQVLFMMIATSTKGDDEVWHDVMSCSDPALLATWGQSIADLILQHHSSRFACDVRFCNGPADGAQTVELDVARYFKSKALAPHHFDHLYSEIQLLGQKLS